MVLSCGPGCVGYAAAVVTLLRPLVLPVVVVAIALSTLLLGLSYSLSQTTVPIANSFEYGIYGSGSTAAPAVAIIAVPTLTG